VPLVTAGAGAPRSASAVAAYWRSMSRRWFLLAALLATACSGSSDGPADAAGPPDAPPLLPPPAGPANLTVTVYAGGSLAVDVPVWFFAGDRYEAAMARTDASGQARGRIEAGGSATADLSERHGPAEPAYVSLVGLEPGDEVQLGATVPPPASPTQHRMTVSFTPQPGVALYQPSCDCGDCKGPPVTTSPATIAFSDACLAASAEIAVIGDAHLYTTVTATLAADGIADATGPWLAAAAGTVSFANVAESAILIQRCSYAGCGSSGSLMAPYAIAVFPFVPQTLDILVGRPVPTAHAPYNGEEREQHLSIAPDQLDVTIDGNADLLPPLDADLNRSQHTVSLRKVAGDYVIVSTPLGGGSWQIIGPPAPTWRLPLPPGRELPTPPLDARPAGLARAYDRADIDGWAAARAHAWAYAAAPDVDFRTAMSVFY
jgi:hypothetical protein